MSEDVFKKALFLYKKGELDRALANLDIFDEHVNVLKLKALLYFAKRDYKTLSFLIDNHSALSDYRELVSLIRLKEAAVPQEGHINSYNLGVFHLNKGNFSLALNFFNKSLSLKSDFDLALYNKAVTLEVLSLKEEAISLYQEFFKASNIQSEDLNSWILKNEWDLENIKALKIDAQYISLNTKFIINYILYYLYSIGELREALDFANKFSKNQIYSKYFWHNRGVLLYKLGNKTQATASYVKALAELPNIYTLYNMHIALMQILKLDFTAALERLLSDYYNLDLTYVYSALCYLRESDFEEALKVLRSGEKNHSLLSSLLKILENSQNLAKESVLDIFAEKLKEINYNFYSLFLNNKLNLKDAIFIFDYRIKMRGFIWDLEDTFVELRPILEEDINKYLIKYYIREADKDISVGKIKALVSSLEVFYEKYNN